MKTLFFALTACASLAAVAAPALPANIQFAPNGTFKAGDANFFIQSYDSGWNPLTNGSWKNRKTDKKADSITVKGNLSISGQTGQVVESIRSTGENQFSINCDLEFPAAAQINGLFGVLSIPADQPTITVDDKEIHLPKEFKILTAYQNSKARKVTVSLTGGRELVFSGNLKFAIQDNRKFNNPTFSLRFMFSPSNGQITQSSLKLNLTVNNLKNKAISLAGAANRAIVDNDNGTGWTGQGPENDLRMLKPGKLTVDGLNFEIVDPAKNQGKSAIIVGGELREFAPASVTLPLPAGSRAGAINLLHASAWTPSFGKALGEMEVKYADGKLEKIPVKSRIDCGNWWNPYRCPNAVVGFRGENKQAAVGLYASSFKLSGKEPVSIRFNIRNQDAAWMILGVNLSDGPIRFPAVIEREIVIKPNYQWKEMKFERKIAKGSALDFSFLNDAPAGKHGFITKNAKGELVFEKEPGKRIRLYGPNLCFSASYLTKPMVDEMAEYFVRCGYNTVRVHHHDTEILDRNAKDTLTFSKEKLDRLDYLFFKMKERGIYIVTDLYTNRVFKPGDNIPECDYFGSRQMKTLLAVSPAAMENWKEFSRRWMNHVNPYTGLKWGEDPALFCINLVNEEVLYKHWANFPGAVKLYRQQYEQWKKARNLNIGKATNDDRYFQEFLHDLQTRVLDEQMRFVKNELKLKTMVTSLNYMTEQPLTLQRNKFDLVDNHAYFDHPGFVEEKWRAPYKYGQQSATKRYAAVPRTMMPSRIPGLPFIVTEFNYCNPNLYRAEGGPLIGAYAALQDWDGLFRFAWSHSAGGISKVGAASGFDGVNDPMAQFSDRIAIALFLRGDASTAREEIAYRVPDDFFRTKLPTQFPNDFSILGLITKIGSAPTSMTLPKGVISLDPANASKPSELGGTLGKLWSEALKAGVARSSTGELLLNTQANTFAVTTARTESLTLPKGALSGKVLSVRNASCFQTVAAISLDGKPLSESSSIVLFQLTNLSNTGATYANESRQILKKTGTLPLLLEKGSAVVQLTAASPWKVVALNTHGEELGEVKSSFKNGKFEFTAATDLYPAGVMVYHLTR